MNDEFIVISAWVKNPHDQFLFKSEASDEAKCTVLSCKLLDGCKFYKDKQCIQNKIFDWKCPYGKAFVEKGPTKRSKKCRQWVSEKKEKYKDVYNKVSNYPTEKLAIVGEWIYLPYSHINMNQRLPFETYDTGFSSGSRFLDKHHFDVSTIENIVKFYPESLMGGQITSYQKEVVPKFLTDLSEEMPELYSDFISKFPQYKLKLKDCIGRKALLVTTEPFEVSFKDKYFWKWDGEKLTSKNSDLLFLSGICNKNNEESIEDFTTVIVPSKDTVVKITDKAQVTGKTIFVD